MYFQRIGCSWGRATAGCCSGLPAAVRPTEAWSRRADCSRWGTDPAADQSPIWSAPAAGPSSILYSAYLPGLPRHASRATGTYLLFCVVLGIVFVTLGLALAEDDGDSADAEADQRR